MSVNKVILLGIVGKKPEIRTTQDGKKVASFSLATSESWKDKNTGEKKEKTEWHNISVFGGLAGIVESYVDKGSKLYVEGAIKTEKYTDKNGVEKYVTKIVLSGFDSKLEMLSKKEDGFDRALKACGTVSEENEAPQEDSLDDNIPF